MFVTVHFPPRSHQHIGGKGQPAQTFLGALVTPDAPLVAGGHNDHQIHIAVFGGRAPGVRAEKPDLLRLKFGSLSFNRFFLKVGLNCLHAIKTSIKAAALKV